MPPVNDQGEVSGSTTQAQVKEKTSETIPGQYIVVFEDQAEGVINEQAAQAAVQRTQSVLSDNRVSRDSVMFQYKYASKGFSAKLGTKQVEKLKRDPRVKRVTQARMFHVGVVSIKVCDNAGCPEPQLLNGIDYVGNQAAPDDIVNISIWNTVGIDPDLDDAVTTAADNGVRLVLIAGNATDDANNYSPGRVNHPNIWTISAYDDTDAFATSFSNYGNPPIEFAGLGVDVPSLDIGGGVTTMSGISM